MSSGEGADSAADPRADALPARLPPRAGRRDPGLVHAPGRAIAAGVPCRPRARASLIEITRDPALCAEVTLQPVRRLGVDAAILFADITTPFSGLGVAFDIKPGVGPVIEAPIRTAADVEPLQPFDPEAAVGPLLEAIRLIRAASPVPLIGFAGAPFTLACYLIEGGPSREFLRTRAFMHSEPAAWAALMERLVEMTVRYLSAQVAAGVQAVQVFDSWVGGLGPARLRPPRRPVDAPPLRRPGRTRTCPRTHFGIGTAGCLSRQAAAGGDVIGLDWRIALADGWDLVGDRAVQGNLDPALLLGPFDAVADAAELDPGPGRRPARTHLQPWPRGLARDRSRPPPSTRGPGPRPDQPKEHPVSADAVLLMAYGSPDRLDQVEAYYTDIRRGSPPSPELLDELLDRYRAIGGGSPLSRIVETQRAALERELAERGEPGPRVRRDAPHRAADRPGRGGDGRRRRGAVRRDRPCAAGILERRRLPARRGSAGSSPGSASAAPAVTYVDSWYDQPRFIEALADTTREALARFADPTGVRVMFTAHSLPARVLADGDPYPDEARRQPPPSSPPDSAWPNTTFAYQSAGRTGEPWIGPDILAEIRRLAAAGVTELVIRPVGFVADHLEVLYDIDIEAQAVARGGGDPPRAGALDERRPDIHRRAGRPRGRRPRPGIAPAGRDRLTCTHRPRGPPWISASRTRSSSPADTRGTRAATGRPPRRPPRRASDRGRRRPAGGLRLRPGADARLLGDDPLVRPRLQALPRDGDARARPAGTDDRGGVHPPRPGHRVRPALPARRLHRRRSAPPARPRDARHGRDRARASAPRWPRRRRRT